MKMLHKITYSQYLLLCGEHKVNGAFRDQLSKGDSFVVLTSQYLPQWNMRDEEARRLHRTSSPSIKGLSKRGIISDETHWRGSTITMKVDLLGFEFNDNGGIFAVVEK
tara:strand:+ start:260 stop:583 length:324 start_codon:yes stop_codon:yes gene_type:complete